MLGRHETCCFFPHPTESQKHEHGKRQIESRQASQVGVWAVMSRRTMSCACVVKKKARKTAR